MSPDRPPQVTVPDGTDSLSPIAKQVIATQKSRRQLVQHLPFQTRVPSLRTRQVPRWKIAGAGAAPSPSARSSAVQPGGACPADLPPRCPVLCALTTAGGSGSGLTPSPSGLSSPTSLARGSAEGGSAASTI